MSSSVTTAKVSHRGQTSLPASLRHRWGIAEGGRMTIIDLGSSALVLPVGVEGAKAELHRVLADRYDAGLAAIDDPDLRDQ